ncbi:MAG TPA: hypothetical protein VFO79_10125, partial [Xanthomonadales bacterium]|nr:hypothetical protein [Xanthomonadales bacterium]
MNMLTLVHVAGGGLAIVAGTVAIGARKGGALHRHAGTWFFVAMLVLGVTASILAPMKDPPDSVLGGILTCYFVATSWVTARRRDGRTGTFELFACAFALGGGVLLAWSGFTAETSPTPVGRGPVFALATVFLLAGVGDLRAILRRQLTPPQRISRHLWRMCFAFFIATGSFFLGQQDVMPAPVRGSPLLFVLAFAPLAAMLYWLLRVRFGTRL